MGNSFINFAESVCSNTDAHLTIKPSKRFLGYTNVEFLGHPIRRGMIETQHDNIRKILEAVIPLSKKQVRSFLGLLGFYHKFIPDYAHWASLLSDLTKRGMPERLVRSGKSGFRHIEEKAMR